jgi:hypothetical protein
VLRLFDVKKKGKKKKRIYKENCLPSRGATGREELSLLIGNSFIICDR